MKKSLAPVLICVIFAALGVIFLLMGINMNAKNKELAENCTEEVQGVVSDFYVSGQYYRNSDDEMVDERLYHPIFEYEVNNEKYRQQSPTGKSKKRFAAGESITVMYNPANPDEYYVPADVYAAKTGNMVIGFGSFMIAFLGFLLIMAFIKNRK